MLNKYSKHFKFEDEIDLSMNKNIAIVVKM